MAIDSIIFDLDGTLWDATDIIVESWNKALKDWGEEQGISISTINKEQIKSVMGLQIKEIGAKLMPNLDEKTQEEVMARGCDIECRELSVRGGLLYPGVVETIKLLSEHYPLFIVSNCQCGYIESFFAAHGLESYFKDFENPGRTGLTKGENIKLIIKRNQLKHAVYVGDTMGDAKAAELAGVPFIYARYGFGQVENYSYGIEHFSELVDVVKRA